VNQRPDARSALTFRLARRRYALALDRTSGVRDLGAVRRIPNAPRPWYGLTDWGDGRVLNVIDLPVLLRDAAAEDARSIVRLRAPHEDLALFVPAHLGLGEWIRPEPADGEPFTAVDAGPDAVHWVEIDALLQLAAAERLR
jgi:hypothetical protein